MCGTLITAIAFSFTLAFVTFVATAVITDMIPQVQMLLQASASHFWGSGLLASTVGCSWVLASFSVLIMTLHSTFSAYLVPGGAFQKPLLGEIVIGNFLIAHTVHREVTV